MENNLFVHITLNKRSIETVVTVAIPMYLDQKYS